MHFQEQKPSLILCGDLNSEPQYGIYKLLTEGHVPSTHSDWFSGENTLYHEALF